MTVNKGLRRQSIPYKQRIYGRQSVICDCCLRWNLRLLELESLSSIYHMDKKAIIKYENWCGNLMEIYINVQFASGFSTYWIQQPLHIDVTGFLSTPLHSICISFDSLLTLLSSDKKQLKEKKKPKKKTNKAVFLYLPYANAFYIPWWHLCFSAKGY